MTFSERMVAGSFGVVLLIVGGRLAWLLGMEAFAVPIVTMVFLLVGAICVCGALTLGDGA